ncbi:beta-N-acetylhexosaminidase [Ornithobacterium rhinotracheale]|uniref:beta-N-acetylhexosaminidase n=1 Tax=Ornithobacterium rhinotracheale TaxID=28251 RepID=UPI003FA443EA
MKFYKTFGAMILCLFLGTAMAQFHIIPKPVELHKGEGSFLITEKTRINYPKDADTQKLVQYFKNKMVEISGYYLKDTKSPSKNVIVFSQTAPTSLGKEGYELEINPEKITIKYNSREGAFYGVQTLLQMLPMVRNNAPLIVQSVQIKDYPRYKWRGMMLDVSRHFYSVEAIKQTLDMLAFYKVNTFQWHLCDNEGWRLEIKKYPKLTEIGAWRMEIPKARIYQKDTVPTGEKYLYGGYYTQEQAKDIVAYAKERNITVIPEIEMPGHSGAALAAYPQFSCNGKAQKTPNSILHHTDEYRDSFNLEYCAGKDETFTFLENILKEVMEIFPSEYIHIGGDEVDKKHWETCTLCQARMKKENLKDTHELQSYFVKRIEKFLTKHHRKLLGWDEILEGGLAPSATVMSWRGEKGGIAAAKMGHDVVMSPSNPLYFIRHQDRSEIGKYWAPKYSINTLEAVYAYNPSSDKLSPEQQKYVLGTQFAVWTEFMSSVLHYEYMIYPRMQAFAEMAWTPLENKNFDDFVKRLNEYHFDEWKLKGINFYPKYYDKTAY